MTQVYVETSALLTWLLGEPRAEETSATIDEADQVLTSVLTLTEAARGLLRAEQLGRLNAAQRIRLQGMLEQVRLQWMLMEVTAEVLERAEASFPAEPVRTLDALHLATVLAFLRVYPDLTVLSFDRRVRDNTLALGIDLSAG